MRNLRPFVLLFAGAVLASVIFPTPAPAAVSFNFFYSNLSPHGDWMVSGSYGRVWQPATYRPGWNPYYDGHWEETDLGNTWVSDYEWGGIPYHYGTWVFDPRLGWVWVPGYTWAPAWVVFRTGPDYIGWAPVRPNFSVGITIRFDDYDPNQFVFVPAHAFFEPRLRRVVVPAARRPVIIHRTRIVNNSITIENNVVVNRGLSVRELRRATGRRVRPVPIERVPGLGSMVRREEIRVDPVQVRHGVKAAEPARARVTREPGRNERFEREARSEGWQGRDGRFEGRAGRDEAARDVDRGSRTNGGRRVDRREPVSRNDEKAASTTRRGDSRGDAGATRQRDARGKAREQAKEKDKNEKDKEKPGAKEDNN